MPVVRAYPLTTGWPVRGETAHRLTQTVVFARPGLEPLYTNPATRQVAGYILATEMAELATVGDRRGWLVGEPFPGRPLPSPGSVEAPSSRHGP